jgi:hypothetical protein
MKRYLYLVIVVAAALVALPAAAQQDQQNQTSLGDLSKQAKKPAKVLTEDDISKPSDTAAATTDSSQDGDKDADKDKKDAVAADDPRSDVEKAQDDVKQWTHEEAALKGKLDKLQEKEAAEPSEFRKQMYRDAYNNQQTTLGELAQKRAEAEKRLSDAQAKENEEGGPKPKEKKPAAGSDQAKSEETPQ